MEEDIKTVTMCFYPSKRRKGSISTGKSVRVAREDIITFKALRTNVSTKYHKVDTLKDIEDNLLSAHQCFHYEMRRLYKQKGDLKWGAKVTSISVAYHSYFTFRKAVSYRCFSAVIVRCIIPKGSLYMINEYGEVVSNKIILHDVIYSDIDIRNKPEEYISDAISILARLSIKGLWEKKIGAPYNDEIYKQL